VAEAGSNATAVCAIVFAARMPAALIHTLKFFIDMFLLFIMLL
jgi:hypothetical protein